MISIDKYAEIDLKKLENCWGFFVYLIGLP